MILETNSRIKNITPNGWGGDIQKNKSASFDEINTDLLFQQAPIAFVGSFICAVVFAWVTWQMIPGKALLYWLVAGTAILLSRAADVWRFRQQSQETVDYRYWRTRFTLLAAISALSWGLVPFLFFAELSQHAEMFAIITLTALSAGALPSMSSIPSCYRIFLLFALAPLIVYLGTTGDFADVALAFLVMVYAIFMVLLSRRLYATTMVLHRSKQRDAYHSKVAGMLAHGSPLAEILNTIVLDVETEDSSVICSILLTDNAGERLHYGAAPHLPDFYNAAIEGLVIGPEVGSCGTATHSGTRVIVEDIRAHPYWVHFREVALRASLLSCWSEPIKSSSGKILGAFAVYHREPCKPDPADIRRIEIAANVAGVAIERSQFFEEREIAAMVYDHSSEAMVVTDAEECVIAINAAFTQITGYASQEILGKPIVFNIKTARDAAYRQMKAAVLATGIWQGELWSYRKEGERFPCRVTINSVYDIQGRLVRRIVLLSDITEQKRSDELIWQQANYDPLVGLPNRRLFRDRLEQEILKASRGGMRTALLFLDLDRFKEINDRLGHDAGDRLLIEAAKRIASCVRESDTLARLGGDEFTVILSNIESDEAIERVARAILEQMVLPFHLLKEHVHISASIGITVYPNDAEEFDELIKNADLAMYAAKNEGRNRLSYYTRSTRTEINERMQMVNDLRSALSANQFSVHYQPIIDFATQRITKAEALLRWHHPLHGMISPARFIPRAEESGLIGEIGDWVFREAVRVSKRWSDLTGEDFQVSLNVSPVQLHAVNACDGWLEHLVASGVPGRNIVFEITEGLLLKASLPVIELLRQFKVAGVKLAIDDFGTGYSSLAYLKKFAIDYLKIDIAFIRDIATDSNDRILAETIIVMGHKLGIKVVSEGVENELQHNILASAGCDFGQGYLFSRPLPEQAFEATLLDGVQILCRGAQAGRTGAESAGQSYALPWRVSAQPSLA